MKKLSVFLCAMVLVFGLVGTANSALIDRGGGLIYDEDQDITWLQDASYAYTSGYDDDGRMYWDDAMAWADQLVYGGHSDWRLPSTLDGPYVWGFDGETTSGYNITSSELGYMYYINLGNLGYYDTNGNSPQPNWGLSNTTPFINLNPCSIWSGTEYGVQPSLVWWFGVDVGAQTFANKDSYNYTWAVHDGDIGAVPIPSAIWLLGSAFIGLVGFRKKFRKG